MTLVPKELKTILDCLEKLCPPAFEETTKQVKVRGSTLLATGQKQYQTPAGILMPVKPENKYYVHKPITVQVNHRRRMKRLIEDAKDLDDMNSKLAEYIHKFGDRKTVQQSIFLSTNKN